jgi:hypothetical protein
MRRMRKDRRILGSSAHLPDMWSYALLRQLTEPARQQTRARDGTSCHRVRTGGGALVVLLPRRDVLQILRPASARVGYLFSLGLFDKFSNLRCGHCSRLPRHFETVLKQGHGWNCCYAKTNSQAGNLFGVYLRQNKLTGRFLRHFPELRRNHFARAAPWRPEIDQHRQL